MEIFEIHKLAVVEPYSFKNKSVASSKLFDQEIVEAEVLQDFGVETKKVYVFMAYLMGSPTYR